MVGSNASVGFCLLCGEGGGISVKRGGRIRLTLCVYDNILL